MDLTPSTLNDVTISAVHLQVTLIVAGDLDPPCLPIPSSCLWKLAGRLTAFKFDRCVITPAKSHHDQQSLLE